MGMECPFCHKQAAYIAAITATGIEARDENDIIARRLECGHVVGTAEYNEYIEKIHAIEAQEFTQLQAVRSETKKAKTALWAAQIKTPEVI